MHGLPSKSLAAINRGCNRKNSLRKPRSGLIKKFHLTRTPNVRGVSQLLFYKLFCKVLCLARRSFLASGGHLKPVFFQIYTKPLLAMIFNYFKFHWNWSTCSDIYSRYTQSHWALYKILHGYLLQPCILLVLLNSYIWWYKRKNALCSVPIKAYKQNKPEEKN